MDCFAALAMTVDRHVASISRHDLPELCQKPPALSKQRAQGMPDARCTRDLVSNVHEKVRPRAYRAAENIRHSLRNGFTAYSVLSPENGSFASVGTQGMNPGQLDASTAASGPHVFAVRSHAVRQGTSASTATRPTFVTWPTPLLSGRDGDRCAPDLPFGK